MPIFDIAGSRVPSIQNSIISDQTTNAAAGVKIGVFMQKVLPVYVGGEGGSPQINCQM
jgi:hypothetical protein